MRSLLAALFATLICAIPLAAEAHLLPAQNATLHLKGVSAFTVVSTPVSALSGVDDDGDRRLSATELGKHHVDIERQFKARFILSDKGKPGLPRFTWVLAPTDFTELNRGVAYVVVMQRTDFPAPPKALTLKTDLFGVLPGEGQLTMRARLDERIEVAMLDGLSKSHRFFRGPLETFVDFIRIGVEHILLGPDHLLFLLTVIVASAGWRYWAGVVTSFTLAHSITLTLAALGVVRISPSIIEPAIAASIVLMAVDNLWRGARVGRERLFLVTACGLLHGLGFAAALGDIGLDAGHRIASLAGFNIGVELGQMVFLAAMLGLAACGAKLMQHRWPPIWVQGTSTVAAILGAVMLLTRIIPGLPITL